MRSRAKRSGLSTNDRPRAVAEKPFEHFREAWMVADRVRAAHRRIVEGLDDLVARGPGVSFDRRALALVALLVRAAFARLECAGRRRPS
jgi:hypothetical protein